MSSENPFQIVSSKIVYENPWMRVREDAVIRPDGSNGIYGVMESEDSVVVIALNERSEAYLIQSFSYPAAAWSWTLPGGGGDSEKPEVAAKRELAEETGIVASSWNFLGKTRIAGGLITERTAFFLAQDLTYNERQDADDKDLIKPGKFVTFDTINTMIDRGEINDCQTITGIHLVQQWIARLAVADNADYKDH